MTDLSELFDLDGLEEPESDDFERGRWNWGRIRMPDGSTRDYPRISTLGDQISSGPGLNIWERRHVALSVARNPDIAAVIAGLEYGSSKLDEFIDDSLERAKIPEKSNWGTAIHRMIDTDAPRQYMHPRIRADVEEYDSAIRRKGITLLESNIKIVNDILGLCGTADGLYRMPDPCIATINEQEFDVSGKALIGDAKSGQNFMPVKWAVQKATYATGVRYDLKTGERSPLHPDLDTRIGVVIYIRFETGQTEFHFVDLEVGFMLAQLCRVLHAQGSKGQKIIGPVPDYVGAEATTDCIEVEAE